MENNEVFFKSADESISKIIEKLRNAKDELDKIYETHQKGSDLQRGLVVKKGVYLPLKSIEHRIMLDGYEVQFLGIFIDFLSEFTKDKQDNIFKEFAIRTLAEMGLKDSQILFNLDLSEQERNRFKTIIMLENYASLGFDSQERKNEFDKLLEDQKHLLSENQSVLFGEMKKNLVSKDKIEFNRYIKRIRKLIESTRQDLYLKTTTPTILRSENVEAFFSAFSHILHGNTILLTDLFSKKRQKNRNRLRVTWTALMTGINTLIHVSNFLEKKGIKVEHKDILQDFDKASRNIAKYWVSLEN